VLEHNRVRGAHLDALLRPLREDPRIEHFRRCGMIWAFDVRAEAIPVDRGDAPSTPFSRRYFSAARDHGVLLRPIGRTVYLMPPYILSEAENEHLARGTLAALDAALAH